MVRLFNPAKWRTKLEKERIRKERCMICWHDGPSYVFDAYAQDYDEWCGRLWPLCKHHRWEVQRLGIDAFLAKYNVERRPSDGGPD